MSAASVSHDLLLPRPPGGMVPGAALALLAHAAMLLALTTVVQWRSAPVESISAELWSALPQAAAPPAPPPAPTPAPTPEPLPRPVVPPPPPVQKAEPPAPDPQIAIAKARERAEAETRARADRERAARERAALEKAARDKAERERAQRDRLRLEREAEAKKREAEARKREQQARVEEERLAQQRRKNLERIMGQAGSGTASSSGTAAQPSGPSGPSASYTGRLIAAIKPNIVFTETVSGNPATEVEVRTGPSGTILARRLLKSSGHKDWDDAVLRAIDRTATLPRDVDGRVPPVIVIAFRPNE